MPAAGRGLRGVIISDLVPGGSAERAGLRKPRRVGSEWSVDVILAIEGERVAAREDLVRSLLSRAVGEQVRVQIPRDSEEPERVVPLQRISGD